MTDVLPVIPNPPSPPQETLAFVDVITAVSPWEKTDYNARYEGCARFWPVLQTYADLLGFLRTAHEGPVIGEGNAHVLYAGWVDSAAEYQTDLSEGGWQTPPLVDFTLLRIHPLMVSHGVGYFPYYFAQGDSLKWSAYTLNDHYMATEIIFCHAGYVDSPELFASVERTIAAQQLEQVFVEYENGLQVYVNRHPAREWPVPLDAVPSWADFSAWVNGAWQDFVSAPHDAFFLLPPNGWLAFLP